MAKRIHRQEGFTLIELMIVILIIGILVGIAVPVFLAAQTSARRGTCQANMRTIDSAIMTYGADNAGYAGIAAVADLVPEFLQSEPTCPDDGASYTWVAPVGAEPPTVTCPNGHPKQGE